MHPRLQPHAPKPATVCYRMYLHLQVQARLTDVSAVGERSHVGKLYKEMEKRYLVHLVHLELYKEMERRYAQTYAST